MRAYDEGTYVHPGELLAKVLDREDLDWERIEKIDPHRAQVMTASDKKYEKAVWEIANNKPPPTVAWSRARVALKAEAEQEMGTAVGIYRQTEAAADLEAAKAGDLAAIQLSVEAVMPGDFQGNALCMALWTCATTNKGKGGYYELGADYDEATLRQAWILWGPFQANAGGGTIKGFDTWRIGNGTAQDKSGRADYGTRSTSTR